MLIAFYFYSNVSKYVNIQWNPVNSDNIIGSTLKLRIIEITLTQLSPENH